MALFPEYPEMVPAHPADHNHINFMKRRQFYELPAFKILFRFLRYSLISTILGVLPYDKTE